MDGFRMTDDILRRDRRQQQRRERAAKNSLGILTAHDTDEGVRLDGGRNVSPYKRLKGGLANYFLGAGSRTYGFFFLIFGIITLLLHFADYYIETAVIDVFYPLLCGVVCSVLSIPLLIPDTPLYQSTDNDPLISFVLYDFFCFKHFQSRGGVVLKKRITIPLAVLLSVVGFFTDPWYVLFTILGLIFFPLALSSPEFPFLLSLLLLPYFSLMPHGSILLGCLVGVGLLSYLRKLLLGNRTFTPRGYDIIIIFFCLFYLVSGIFNGGFGSFTSALMMIVLTSGYTLSSGLISNRRIADSATSALGLLSFPVSFVAIYQYFFTGASDKWSDPMFSDFIRTRVTGTFHNPNVLAMFLTVAALFSLYQLREAKTFVARTVCALILALHLFALTLTFSRGAYIALALTMIALFIMRYAKHPGILLFSICALPYTLFLLPESIIERLLSALNLADSSIAYRMSILRSSLSMFFDRIFLGVGVGEETFRDAFFQYAEEGTYAPHSHNLLLQIGCEAGIFALAAFVILLLVRARQATLSVSVTRKSTVRLVTVYSLCALVVLLLFGISDYIWSTFSLYYLFWVVFGIGSAALRIAKREREDLANYYGDDQSPESSIIDIRLH